MTLLITVIAAVVSTIVWYFNPNRKRYLMHLLPLAYWGASLMWSVDFAFEYAELGAEYFNQDFASILNDSLLGLAVVTLGLCVWIAIVLVKDPKGVMRRGRKTQK